MPKKTTTKDLWKELCELVREDDHLPARPVGPWSADKLYFWHRYLDITTTAMVGHPQWTAGLVYVDLFAGPGVCKSRGTKDRFPGSPLIAATTRKPFCRILLCEEKHALAESCRARLSTFAPTSNAQVFEGDCNKRIDDIVKEIPHGALTLAFVDPTGLHAEFETLRKLSNCGRVDLLILFADRMGIVRNVEAVYEKQKSLNLDRVLGPDSNWRLLFKELNDRSPTAIGKMFADLYTKQLARLLGYKVFGDKVIPNTGHPFYRLIYASKHERGLEFWEKVTKKDRQGQTEFDF